MSKPQQLSIKVPHVVIRKMQALAQKSGKSVAATGVQLWMELFGIIEPDLCLQAQEV